MDCVGRMVEILLCILCLTLIPATSILQNNKSRERNYIEMRAEELYGRVKREKCLQKTEYERFKNLLAACPDYDYEFAIAKRYVLPVGMEEIENQILGGIRGRILFCRRDLFGRCFFPYFPIWKRWVCLSLWW